MFSASSLIAILVLALAVAANPVVVRSQGHITLPVAKRINAIGTTKLVEGDRARARALRARVEARQSGTVVTPAAAAADATVTNGLVSYLASVQVGSPATTFDLIVDTGSSNTWVGAGTKFKSTSTTVQTKNKVAVTYGSGSFSGTEFTDTVSLGSGLTITAQSIGVASKSTGFSGVDGIVGIGPVDLTLDTLSPATTSTIPTVVDNLFSQGLIPEHLIAVAFAPTTTDNNANGELTFGGTDSSKFTGSITFTPITTTSPASEFWGINESIEYGTSTTIQATTAGIVDTGTTLTLLSTNAISAYQKATGAKEDETTGLLKLTSAQFSSLESLFFTIGGTKFEFTANAQLWPRALNTDIGGVAGDIYLIVGSIGTPSGEGLDFINGQTWLERFYAVFDTANARVGFATTANTDSTAN